MHTSEARVLLHSFSILKYEHLQRLIHLSNHQTDDLIYIYHKLKNYNTIFFNMRNIPRRVLQWMVMARAGRGAKHLRQRLRRSSRRGTEWMGSSQRSCARTRAARSTRSHTRTRSLWVNTAATATAAQSRPPIRSTTAWISGLKRRCHCTKNWPQPIA